MGAEGGAAADLHSHDLREREMEDTKAKGQEKLRDENTDISGSVYKSK